MRFSSILFSKALALLNIYVIPLKGAFLELRKVLYSIKGPFCGVTQSDTHVKRDWKYKSGGY